MSKLTLTSSLALTLLLTACAAVPDAVVSTNTPEAIAATETQAPVQPTATTAVEATATPEDTLVFAVIGDYGQAGDSAYKVAEMIDSWQVDFITTTGDNNYPNGEAETIDDNIGQYYHRYIGDYKGSHNRGSEENRFFPSLGNHDVITDNGQPYFDYFTLPGNERYYDVVIGPVHLFILNSDTSEPDGVGRSSAQAEWLQAALAASTVEWQVVVAHHPPYSSGLHGPTDWIQWPFEEWGADVMIAGHDHLYERLEVDGFLYFINGLGGHEAVYDFEAIHPGSVVRYNAVHGAMRVEVAEGWIRFQFINVNGDVVDDYTLEAD
jgi:tartrate-resistant acid phosphatase type 5